MKLDVKKLTLLVSFGLLIGAIGLVSAAGLDAISTAMWDVYGLVDDILIPAAFLALVSAAVIYAVGQVGSSDMRAKAQGWATWALAGAAVAFVLKFVGTTIICSLSGGASGLPTGAVDAGISC